MAKIKFNKLFLLRKCKVVVVPHYYDNLLNYYDEYYSIIEPEWIIVDKKFTTVPSKWELKEKEKLIKDSLSKVYPEYDIKFIWNSYLAYEAYIPFGVEVINWLDVYI